MSWRVAKSLLHLLAQVNALAPNRAKGSDGGIGDAAHQASTSDHNPWVRDRNGQPIVTAYDITHDPRNGVDTYKMASSLLASRDKRIKYIISNGKIASPSIEPKWGWRRYNGSNPHDHHVHISVQPAESLFDDESDWKLGEAVARPDPTAPEPDQVVRYGDSGPMVAMAQLLLGIKADGVFGQGTKHSTIEFQKARGLVADGIIGPATWAQLKTGAAVDKPKIPPEPREQDFRFHSMIPGGFFSDDPFDKNVNTSVRTNNPGAINAAPWVKTLPGYLGDKVTSVTAGANNTAIFETPEDGVAAWYHLMRRYAANGNDTLREIIRTYGGGQDYSAYETFVAKRIAQQRDWKVPLEGNDTALVAFAKAMFRYEAGLETPLSDEQILHGFKLARGETQRV